MSDFSAAKTPKDRFDFNRIVITRPYGPPFEPSPGFRPKRWLGQRKLHLERLQFSVSDRATLLGGLCSVRYEARITCQATIEYVRRFYKLVDVEMNEEQLAPSIKQIIEHELAATAWPVLTEVAGVNATLARIKEVVERSLSRKDIEVNCDCRLDSGKASPELGVEYVIGRDGAALLRANEHQTKIATIEQERKHLKEIEDQKALDRAAEVESIKKAGEAEAAKRRQQRENYEQEAAAELADKELRDKHAQGMGQADIEARIATWQRDLAAEEQVRRLKLAQLPLDEEFLGYETKMLRLEAERARAERDHQDVARLADDKLEEAKIQLTQARADAEHSWELRRLDLLWRGVRETVAGLGAAPHAVDHMSVVQFQSGDGTSLPTSPAFQLSQAALVVRELFKLVAEQK
jgi:hypothetical protein